ncbi:VOC family protein, partial [Rhodococcus sp. 05-340-2]|uniref:VOC family protein n=1 Tax=Rhodococcus sp. 05-340-2 TaxID=2022504 RepID=UPI001C52B5F4
FEEKSMSITALGYLGVSSPRYQDWREFGGAVLGAQVTDDGPDGAVRLRIDDVDWRVQIHPGEQDRLEYIGWLAHSEKDLPALVDTLAGVGIEASWGSRELAESRGVFTLITFTDPWGFSHEVAWGQTRSASGFIPGRPMSGFVTGAQGLGHVVLILPDVDAGHTFFTETLGFEFSDAIIDPTIGDPEHGFYGRFYHVNARHHTLALVNGPPHLAGLHHLMLQVRSIDDMGTAHGLLDRHNVPETLGIGRHTNDEMVSFYCTTPSLFNIEYGYDGIELDTDHTPKLFGRGSIWGHKLNPESRHRAPGLMHPLPTPTT